MQDYPAYKGQIEGCSEGNIAGNNLKIRKTGEVSKRIQLWMLTEFESTIVMPTPGQSPGQAAAASILRSNRQWLDSRRSSSRALYGTGMTNTCTTRLSVVNRIGGKTFRRFSD